MIQTQPTRSNASKRTKSRCMTISEGLSRRRRKLQISLKAWPFLRWMWFEWTEPEHPWVGTDPPATSVDQKLFRANTIVTIGDATTTSFWMLGIATSEGVKSEVVCKLRRQKQREANLRTTNILAMGTMPKGTGDPSKDITKMTTKAVTSGRTTKLWSRAEGFEPSYKKMIEAVQTFDDGGGRTTT
ncbi:protein BRASSINOSTEROID INSENSITIVE 1-like [Panicum miliaceum]|uniref:Protein BRASSINOSTEROID INSENSITIVE 1-like n=1 Tax=Panicum miliaceum TaxID=4540 RepID=A0A3L6S292_PANMI|nr:protein BRASSINOSTEROID INSENSITIVE 1-like [Panicum miliaceum]